MMLALAMSLSLAQPQPQPDAMHRYFASETAGSWTFGGLGLASLGAGAAFLARGDRLGIGASVPLLAVGVLQLALAIGLGVRTPGQVAALELQAAENPDAFRAAESARMERVMRGFVTYKIAEVGLFFAGLLLAGVGGAANSDFSLGAGLSLAAESLVMLILDVYAEGQGRVYQQSLRF